jgi:hypothetical protein
MISTYIQLILLCAWAVASNAATMELFAVLGNGGCAAELFYGPSGITTAGSSDGHAYYLSTNTPYKNAATRQWLQIVKAGNSELFRITWTFNTDKTIAQRFADAVAYGEPVTYTIVSSVVGVSGGTYSGRWWFNSDADITARTFQTAGSTCCFSDSGGAWGGASGTVDASNYRNLRQFWGHAHFDARNSDECEGVYINNRYSVLSDGTPIVSYMYHATGTDPTPRPTPAPSAAPSNTASPTFPAPTARPSFSPQPTILGQELFAVVGGDSCAESLYYGPQDITTTGSRDGQHPYYLSTSTAYRYVQHTDWLQIVTSDGTNELFRVYWTFDTARTLAQHFATAVQSGVAVSYRVVTAAGGAYVGTDTWTFSTGSGVTAGTFETTSTRCCFSASDGAWGLGEATVQGRAVVAWGQGNFGGSDTADCKDAYVNGKLRSGAGNGAVSYFYYIPDASSLDGSGGALYALVRFSVSLVSSIVSDFCPRCSFSEQLVVFVSAFHIR